MTSVPPLLSDVVLNRLRAIARLNGLSVVVIASLGAVLEAARGGIPFAVAAVLAAGAGMLEVHGANLLRDRIKEGLHWAIRGELLLLAIIWVYCAVRLAQPDLTEVRAAFHASLELPMMQKRWAEAQELGLTEEQYLNAVYQLTYVAFAFVSLLYQGGMVIYYLRRRGAVETAIGEGEE
jgi:hypothetical protein